MAAFIGFLVIFFGACGVALSVIAIKKGYDERKKREEELKRKEEALNAWLRG